MAVRVTPPVLKLLLPARTVIWEGWALLKGRRGKELGEGLNEVFSFANLHGAVSSRDDNIGTEQRSSAETSGQDSDLEVTVADIDGLSTDNAATHVTVQGRESLGGEHRGQN